MCTKVHKNLPFLYWNCQIWSKFDTFEIESCGARFLTSRPRNAPLTFASTWTGWKNSTFYGPDPELIRLYSARTRSDQTKTIYHQPEIKLQQKREYALQWSNDIIQCANQGYCRPTCSVWEWKACFSLSCKFIPEILGKKCLLPR